MKFIIPLIVILIFLAIIGNRIRKQRNLLNKREEYEKMLRDAKITRYQYIQALQKTREQMTDIEHVEEKLTSLKAELIGYRNDLRKQIIHLRQLHKNATGSDLDKRTLAQKNNDLVQLLAHSNARKKVCMDIEDTLSELEGKLRQQEQNEHEITTRWYTQKDQVLKTYKQYKDRLVLTDPQIAFS